MPLKLTVGLNKKIGLANYGRLAAYCSIEKSQSRSQRPTDRELSRKLNFASSEGM